jgi:hypothetical protein
MSCSSFRVFRNLWMISFRYHTGIIDDKYQLGHKKHRNLQKVCMKTAEEVANAAPVVKASVIGMKIGEYAAYLTGSKIPFVIIL